MELYLEEIACFNLLVESYITLMLSKIKGLTSMDAEGVEKSTNLFKNGNLNCTLGELTEVYIVLEVFFMKKIVKEAIMVNCINFETMYILFYNLQRCCRRIILTGKSETIVACLTGVANLLKNEYLEALKQKMRGPCLRPMLFLSLENTGSEFAYVLNNVNVSCEYISKMWHEIEEQCAKVFSVQYDIDEKYCLFDMAKEMNKRLKEVKSCIFDLAEEVNNKFKEVFNEGMERLVGTLTLEIGPILDNVETISYELYEAEYADKGVNDAWVQELIRIVQTHTRWIQLEMTANNYDTFVHGIIYFITTRLETIILQKRFSELGASQLNRDVRALIKHFSSMIEDSFRNKFARLMQMEPILNFENVSKIMDLCRGNTSLTYRLTPAEVKYLLGLIVKFNELGVLQLDRDVSALIKHFSSMTVESVGDKFARLTQMAPFLNLENVSEIMDLWGEKTSWTWQLTPTEVKYVLGLRVDYNPEAIAALKL